METLNEPPQKKGLVEMISFLISSFLEGSNGASFRVENLQSQVTFSSPAAVDASLLSSLLPSFSAEYSERTSVFEQKSGPLPIANGMNYSYNPYKWPYIMEL